MLTSHWRCPKCNTQLFITNSARYWCTKCQAEKPAERVDQMNRDWKRITILFDMKIEQALGVSFER